MTHNIAAVLNAAASAADRNAIDKAIRVLRDSHEETERQAAEDYASARDLRGEADALDANARNLKEGGKQIVAAIRTLELLKGTVA